MNKPRIMPRRSLTDRRIWLCRSIDHYGDFQPVLRLGYGYTPAEAYADWERQ